MSDSVTIKKVTACARCEGTHENVVALKLRRPIAPPELDFAWTHWFSCPTTGEPVILVRDATSKRDAP